jgi:hypothetical protein
MQNRTRRRTFVIQLNDDEFNFMSSAKESTGVAKQVAGRKALGVYFWNEHGLVFPGYTPDECPFCSFPMSQHDYTPATATSPGEYSCPTLDKDDLPY